MENHKLAQILGIPEDKLSALDSWMASVSGKAQVLDKVESENETAISRVLNDLGLSQESAAEEVYDILISKLTTIDRKLYEFLDRPDLTKLSNDPGKLKEVAFQIFTPPKGFFIKKEKVAELLAKQPPQSLLDHFGYQSVQELIEKEGFASTVAALRFTQSNEWMHQFFDVAYAGLGAEDFEEREVELKVLDAKWLDIAQKFIGHKLHNVSHLKEFGVIFISPEDISKTGETLRTFLLLLHYLHEVPFYSDLFRKFVHDSDFISKLQSLLRGDVPEGPAPEKSWRIVQRYLAKDDPNDFRLHEPHVDPEAEHWRRVAENLPRLAEVMSDPDKLNIGYWKDLDHVGAFFNSKVGTESLVSFDVVDLVMSLVKQTENKYLYHQPEALWNLIFSEYLSRDQLNSLIEENIITGFIKF